MLVLYTREVNLARPVRFIHPRHPVYIVPRGDGRFMIGATMIENDEAGRITARAMLELLGAAYAVHPAFAEAEIIETGAGVRPRFPDNLPGLRGRWPRDLRQRPLPARLSAAPALARRAAARSRSRAPALRRRCMRIEVNGKKREVAARNARRPAARARL